MAESNVVHSYAALAIEKLLLSGRGAAVGWGWAGGWAAGPGMAAAGR